MGVTYSPGIFDFPFRPLLSAHGMLSPWAFRCFIRHGSLCRTMRCSFLSLIYFCRLCACFELAMLQILLSELLYIYPGYTTSYMTNVFTEAASERMDGVMMSINYR